MEISELKEAIERTKLVDGHAHNLVAIDSSFPFIRAFSEADDFALTFAPSSLAFKRSVRDIGKLYGFENNSLLEVENFRKSLPLEDVASRCFKAAKLSAVMIDDGLQLDKKLDIDWFKHFVPEVGRILRIERLAEEILDNELSDGNSCSLDKLTEAFLKSLNSSASEIAGLKSIAAYRSGLAINTHVSREEAAKGLAEIVKGGAPVRIGNKNLIDYLFICALEVAQRFDLPIQLHSGFGDKDLDLLLANPLHLRDVLEDSRFTKCRFVLLHASYPFSQEASYLASVYHQVYLDFGLAVPKLSYSGMVSSVKALLELAPLKKVMYSSDGYAFPETFYLGASKAREVVYTVLRDACFHGDLTIVEAVEAAEDILFRNAMKFYKMNMDTEAYACRDDAVKAAVISSFVRVLWVDASGQHRCRVVPAKRFDHVVCKHGVGLTMACMGMSSARDAPAPGAYLTATGEIRLMPDLTTYRKIPWMKNEDMVMADMHVKPGVEWEYCPRAALRKMTKLLDDEFDLSLNAGFENEFVIFKISSREGKEELTPFNSTPYCSTAGFDLIAPFLYEICQSLHSLGIEVEQLHKEAGVGQYEIAIAHKPCILAADDVVYAREAIRATARKHGMLASFLPKHDLKDVGSGSHVHLSLWRDGKNVFMAADEGSPHGMSPTGEHFMAGILHHLPALLAFTAPTPNSYDRMKPNTWSGAYQCWGRENREAPLRTACPPGIGDGFVSNFEIKSFDASANPFLGLAAVLAAGIDGLRRQLLLPEPVDVVDEKLARLPQSLSEAVEALEDDGLFADLIGDKLLVAVKAIRKEDIKQADQPGLLDSLIHRF